MLKFIRDRPLNALAIALVFAVFACLLFAVRLPWYWVLAVLAGLAILLALQKG